MPWVTPTLRETRSLVRDFIRGSLPGADASVPNSVLRVLSDAQGGMAHLNLQYIDWLSKQLMADTAEIEWLDRHADIWLINADGSVGRKPASYAIGVATFYGNPDVIVGKSAQMTSGQVLFETTEEVTIGSNGFVDCEIRAIDAGIEGNLLVGASLTLQPAVSGVTDIVVKYDMTGGADQENDEDLRVRVLERIRQPPMGGDAEDYVLWTLRCTGVTRAWSFPLEMGIGTVTVRFMMDDLRADNDGFPLEIDINQVSTYLDSVRPVAVKDFFVESPIKYPVTWIITELEPDSSSVRSAIEQSARAMLLAKATPGQTIFAAWKAAVVMETAGVVSFRLLNNTDDIMPSSGHMAMLGDLQYV